MHKRDHIFFSTMAVLMAAVVAIGFGRTYGPRIAGGTATPLIHLHAAVFATWMVLYIVQSVLVARGRTTVHRRLGVWGAFFATALIAVGAVTSVVAARHGFRGNPPGPLTPLQFLLAAPVRDMLVFGGLTGAAIAQSRDVQAHKRLMLMATLGGLVPAGASRLPGGDAVFLPVFFAMLLAGPVYDWLTRRTIHRAYVWGLSVTILTTAVFTGLSYTNAWQSFAQTLID